MAFGTWKVRSLYRAVSLTAAARELVSYELDLVGVREVRWDREGTVRAGVIILFYGRDSLYEEQEQVFYHLPKYHTKILLAILLQK
jgi:hypothetical protein